MKKKGKMILISILVVVGLIIVSYYVQEKSNLDKKVQLSDTIMKDKGITLNDNDKRIVTEILKDDELEYAYISHNNDTVMLSLMFKKGIQEKDMYSKVSKYTERVRQQYKEKNINGTIIPNE